MVAVDGGAFRGAVTQQLLDSGLFARILAFEPDPQSFDVLNEQMRASEQVSPYRVALGERITRLPFYRGDFPATNSLLPRPNTDTDPYYPAFASHNLKVEVDVVDLDTQLAQCELPRIALLKLDLQGGELAALKGAQGYLRARAIDMILTEVVFVEKYHIQPLYHEIASFLSRYEYSLYSIEDIKRGDYDRIQKDFRDHQWNQADAIFLSTDMRNQLERFQ